MEYYHGGLEWTGLDSAPSRSKLKVLIADETNEQLSEYFPCLGMLLHDTFYKNDDNNNNNENRNNKVTMTMLIVMTAISINLNI